MSEYRYFKDSRWPGAAVAFSVTNSACKEFDRGDLPWEEFQVVPLDAIVIDRADLPTQDSILYYEDDGREVEPRIKSGSAHIVIRGASPEYAESTARHYLALAQWLREHPPIDEAAVRQAKIALLDIGYFPDSSAATVAEELVKKGYRIEVERS